jgi:cytoskeletal protein CcmA (bactofilin family)
MERNKKVELSTIIGKGSRIEGTLQVEGGVRIDGRIDGKIESNGFVTIGLSGQTNADIKAKECLISGKVVGNINVTEGLELDRTADLTGDIVAKILRVHTGAVFNGTSKMGEIKKPLLKESPKPDAQKPKPL